MRFKKGFIKRQMDSWVRVHKLIYAKKFKDGVVGIVVREYKYSLRSYLKFPTACISKSVSIMIENLPQKEDFVRYGESTYYMYKKGIDKYDV